MIALVSVVTTAAVAVRAAEARAADVRPAGITQFWDSFEGATPWTRWEGGGDGDGVAGYDINGGVARDGQNNGWLHVGNGWAANRIAVDLNGFYYRHDCAAGVYMHALGAGAVVGLQIWNPNGWHIIAETYPWINGNGSGYHLVVIDNLYLEPYHGVIYLQAIYGNDSGVAQFIRIDDMVLECRY